MTNRDQKENSPDMENMQGNFCSDKGPGNELPSGETARPAKGWAADFEQTLQIGEQFVGVIGGIADLARMEALLAVRALPKMMMLWLLMMPVILLTWCAFSVLIAWVVVEMSDQVGFGILTFFLQQVLLLLVCRLLFVKYRTRMTLPNTRAQIASFVRSTQHGFSSKNKT